MRCLPNKEKTVHLSRLQEKFVATGFAGLDDRQVIEIFLGLLLPRPQSHQLSQVCLREFGSLNSFLAASEEELMQVGLSSYLIFYIKLVHELPKEILRKRIIEQPFYKSPKEVFDYLYLSMRDLKKETLKAVYLNNRNEIIDTVDLFEGTLETILIRPREIVASAITHEAAAIIFIHNHPSGDPAPSKSDKQFTRDLAFVGQIIQIKVLDHIIIGGDSYFSFADEGLIEKYGLDFLNFKIRRVSDSRVNYSKGFIMDLLIPTVMGIATGIIALSDIS